MHIRQLRGWLVRLFGLFHRKRREREFAEELESHLAFHIEDNLRAGMSPEEARRRALLKLGGVTLTKERYREQRGLPMLETLSQDLRFGSRMLRKNPGFSLIAILTLALGIGANTAIFSVIDALLLKPLPVAHPERLVTLAANYPGEGGARAGFVYQTFERLRDQTQVFAGLSAVCQLTRYNLTIQASHGKVDVGQARVGLVSGNYFATLGAWAALGRTLTTEDDRAMGGHPVVVLSHAFWQRQLTSEADVVGRTLALNGTTYTIVGVTSAGFTGEWVGQPTDLWFPMAMQSQVMPEQPGLLTMPNSPTWIRIIARLRPDVTINQAQSIAHAVFAQWMGDTFSGAALQRMGQVQLALESAAQGYSPERKFLTRPLMIMLVLVGLVLLIACANVASLLLQRATVRRREIAVRLALGATPARIVRQLLVESGLLALLGGAAGLLLAQWGTQALTRLVAAGNQPLVLKLSLDARMLAFTSALCLLTGLLFGLTPALRAAGGSLTPAFKGGETGEPYAGGRFPLGKTLVMAQVALSLVLLVGAGLFVRTLRNLQTQEFGFDRERVLLVRASLNQPGRQGAALAQLYQNVQERIAVLPGVVSASPSHGGISPTGFMNGVYFDSAIRFVGEQAIEPGAERRALWYVITPNFFDAMGMRLAAGRAFTAHDTGASPRVVIINQTLARTYFGNENPIGKHFGLKRDLIFEIVGVVKAEKYNSPRDENRLLFFVPFTQDPNSRSARDEMLLAVRTQGRPAELAERVRQELRQVDATLPIISITTMEDELRRALAQERLLAALAGFFGVVAVLLACGGLYGMMSYAVACRTKELGIRFALGARRTDVLRMILRDVLWLAGIGLACGLAAALATTRLIATLLFGVSATDPLTIAVAIALLIVVAVLAGFIPALRAAKTDPLVALRHE